MHKQFLVRINSFTAFFSPSIRAHFEAGSPSLSCTMEVLLFLI